MNIITWNCNMAFRNKAYQLLKYAPDILIIPECEHPDKLLFKRGTKKPTDILWFGENPNKGLGIFSYGVHQFKIMDIYNDAFKMVIPISVSGGKVDFNLFAIWANHPTDPDGQYVEQVWKAVNYYRDHLTGKPTILAGDFNSNTIWDRKSRIGNHSDVVTYLEAKGIFSAYHYYHQQTPGKEEHPTLYLYRHKDKPYHIDYCFISKELKRKLQSVEVGDFGKWKKYSDHMPVMVSFKSM